MIQINVQNSDNADDFVTLIDNNTNPPSTVLNQRVNQRQVVQSV